MSASGTLMRKTIRVRNSITRGMSPGTPRKHILVEVTADGREHSYHATKGWRDMRGAS